VVSLATARATLAAALSTVSGLRVETDGVWPDRANLPAALIRPDDDAEQVSLDGLWLERFEIALAVSSAGGLARGQRALDELHDAAILAILASLPACESIRRRSYGALEIDGVEVMGVILAISFYRTLE
jgi:hypothetical protein